MPTSHAVADLPHTLDGLQIPLKILQRRIHTTDHDVVPQVLVQWSNLPRSLATWEDTEALRQRFPRAPAWGQAGLRRGGDVSNQDASTTEAEPERELGAPSAEHDVVTTELEAPEPRREARIRRPSVHVSGPEWA